MPKRSWTSYPITEVEAEIWRLRFDRGNLLTIGQIIEATGHGGASGLLLSALKRLKSRGVDLPANPGEQELIDLALESTQTSNLDDAYQERNLAVRRLRLSERHKKFHERETER